MSIRRRTALVLASVVGISLAVPVSAAGAASSSDLDEETILTYLDVLDTVNAARALAVASPRSAAWRYAEHQVAVEEANRENGFAAVRGRDHPAR